MPKNPQTNPLDTLAAQFERSFGQGAARRGGLRKPLQVVPTGSLSLDYALGTGGWPRGSLSGVYGPRDIGKSSMIGMSAIRNAQALGLNAAWIALEPFDEAWAEKNGVNVEELLIAYPTTGEEAFAMTLKLIGSGVIDFFVFDSIGAVLSEKEMDEDGKPRVGGQAGLITWFVKAAAPLARKLDVGGILINQTRDVIGPVPGMVQQPGGRALEFLEEVIVRLRKGKERYTIKQFGDDVQIGNQVVAIIERNKKSEGTNKKATFDYFYMETDDYPFGIDEVNDAVNVAKRTGVIKQRGAYYDLPNGESFQGLKSAIEYLKTNPDVMQQVRDGVLDKMQEQNPPSLEEDGK